MVYTCTQKKELLEMIGRNINFYRYHSNNKELMNEKGVVSVERLAEAIDSSPNMIYNLTSKKVEQGASISFLDKIARALDVSLYCFFLNTPVFHPPRYDE